MHNIPASAYQHASLRRHIDCSDHLSSITLSAAESQTNTNNSQLRQCAYPLIKSMSNEGIIPPPTASKLPRYKRYSKF